MQHDSAQSLAPDRAHRAVRVIPFNELVVHDLITERTVELYARQGCR
jgi:hypothetical protein